jgi:hypothetical protein
MCWRLDLGPNRGLLLGAVWFVLLEEIEPGRLQGFVFRGSQLDGFLLPGDGRVEISAFGISRG